MTLKKLSKMLDLELAWRRVKKDQSKPGIDFIPDLLSYDDFERDIVANLERIKKSLDEGYEPSNLLEIDVPKRGYSIRPGSNQKIEDRIVYQALIDFISNKVKEPPPDGVYSLRLNKKPKSNSMFKYWKPLWLEMRRKMRECYNNGSRCFLKTDITAFFEHIDHNILRSCVFDPYIEDKRILDVLDKLLKKWAVSEMKYVGISQGCDPSSFIGNIYLTDIDTIMQREGYRYFRYLDEIYILTRAETEARKALKFLIKHLREMNLNIQEQKTQILTDPDCVKQEIGTEKEDKTREFDYGFARIGTGDFPTETKKEVLERYNKVTKRGRARKVDNVSESKWCLNRLKKFRDGRAVNFVITRLGDLSFMTDNIVSYLVTFVNRKRVKDTVIEFLSSKDNIYEWQEMWLLILLSHAKNLDNHHLEVIRSIIKERKKYWAPRAAAIMTLGKLGNYTDRSCLKKLFWREDNPQIKRAILIACHFMPKQERNTFYGRVRHDSANIKRLISYLKQDKIKTIDFLREE